MHGFELPKRVFPCQTPAEVRAELPTGVDVVAFQCRNPIHRAHYELFTRALYADNVSKDAVCLVHPTVGPTQGDDISGLVRYQCAVGPALAPCPPARAPRLHATRRALARPRLACCQCGLASSRVQKHPRLVASRVPVAALLFRS